MDITFLRYEFYSNLSLKTYFMKEKWIIPSKPGTIARYKTALTIPLRMHFKIDLKSDAFADLIRSMYLQRPNKPITAPAWSLNKVLDFLNKENKLSDKVSLLRKTAFLFLLATGWRISELCQKFRFLHILKQLSVVKTPSIIPSKEWVHTKKMVSQGD